MRRIFDCKDDRRSRRGSAAALEQAMSWLTQGVISESAAAISDESTLCRCQITGRPVRRPAKAPQAKVRGPLAKTRSKWLRTIEEARRREQPTVRFPKLAMSPIVFR